MRELARLLRYSRPYIPHLTASVVLMACVGAAQALTALLIGPIFDRVLNPSSADAPVLLFTLPVWKRQVYLNDLMPASIHNVWTMVAVGILAVFLVKGVCDYFGNYLVNYVGFSAVTDLRQTVFDRVLHQDAQFFENNSTARVMSSIMNDLEKIQVALSHILADWLRQSFTAIGLTAVILQTDWKLAVVSLTLLPFVLVPTLRLGRRIRRTTRRAQDDAAELNQVLQETLSGQQVVKSFGAEEIESNRFRDRAQRLRRSNLRYVAQQAIASPLIEFFGSITIVGLLTYARFQIKAGAMTTGEFSSFVIALLMLYEPVKRLTGIHNIFQQALGASQKVFEYLDREQHIQERPGAAKLSRFEKSILFDNVNFRYPTSPEGFVLEGIRLEVKAGEVIALVGPSGAGKTSLANLVPRFYDAAAGAVRIDGRDVRDLRLASLREKISIVAQDTFLFNDTVANNIGYGRSNATRIFNVNVPVGIIGMLFTIVIQREYKNKNIRKFDILGFITVSIFLPVLLYALAEGNAETNSAGWRAPYILACFAISAVALAVFLTNEFLVKEPLIELRLLKNHNFGISNLIMFIFGMEMFGSTFLLPLFLQNSLDYTAYQSGLVFLPVGIIQGMVSPIVGRISDKTNPKIPIIIGILLLTLSFYLNGFFSFLTERSYIMLSLYIRGFAMGILFTPLSSIALFDIPREKMGQASGIFNVIRQIGGSFGVALFATLLTARVNFHSQVYSQAINPTSQEFRNVKTHLIYHIQRTAGSSYDKALKQSQVAIVADINKQAFIQGVDDDFLIAALITLIGGIPVLFLYTSKKKHKVKDFKT